MQRSAAQTLPLLRYICDICAACLRCESVRLLALNGKGLHLSAHDYCVRPVLYFVGLLRAAVAPETNVSGITCGVKSRACTRHAPVDRRYCLPRVSYKRVLPPENVLPAMQSTLAHEAVSCDVQSRCT